MRTYIDSINWWRHTTIPCVIADAINHLYEWLHDFLSPENPLPDQIWYVNVPSVCRHQEHLEFTLSATLKNVVIEGIDFEDLQDAWLCTMCAFHNVMLRTSLNQLFINCNDFYTRKLNMLRSRNAYASPIVKSLIFGSYKFESFVSLVKAMSIGFLTRNFDKIVPRSH